MKEKQEENIERTKREHIGAFQVSKLAHPPPLIYVMSLLFSFPAFLLVMHQQQYRSLRHCLCEGTKTGSQRSLEQMKNNNTHARTIGLVCDQQPCNHGISPLITLLVHSPQHKKREQDSPSFPPSFFSLPTAKAHTRRRPLPHPPPGRQRKPTRPYSGTSPPGPAPPPRSDTTTSACSSCLGP